MKSVGEAMAIGRTFKESLQKCLRSLEIGRSPVRSEIFAAAHAAKFPSPVGRHIPLLTELEFFSISDATKMPPRRGWRGL